MEACTSVVFTTVASKATQLYPSSPLEPFCPIEAIICLNNHWKQRWFMLSPSCWLWCHSLTLETAPVKVSRLSAQSWHRLMFAIKVCSLCSIDTVYIWMYAMPSSPARINGVDGSNKIDCSSGSGMQYDYSSTDCSGTAVNTTLSVWYWYAFIVWVCMLLCVQGSGGQQLGVFILHYIWQWIMDTFCKCCSLWG